MKTSAESRCPRLYFNNIDQSSETNNTPEVEYASEEKKNVKELSLDATSPKCLRRSL
jgi:hypothetical protein